MIPAAHQTLEEDFRSQLQDYGLRHDPVTGLPNQLCFRPLLKYALSVAAQQNRSIALVWVDVLNLRREYSIGGDVAAERLVSTVADSLRPWVDSGELICRFSERCFLLALEYHEGDCSRFNLIVEAASHRHLRGSEGKPEIAAGVAFFPQHATSPEELMRFASLAAVSSARTNSRVATQFDPAMNSALIHERELEKDLRDALRDDQLSLAYQPQIDLNTGNVFSAECLTRWRHPVRGYVSPAQFIPVAERSNLIQEIFRNSLRKLLTETANWRASGIELQSVAVNASPANIRRDDFVEIIEHELASHDLGRIRLDVEVTESLLMDDEHLFTQRIKALRAIGVHVALDDFGTRYTGFNALKDLPLNTMKIDKCFVHRVDQSAQARSLCRTIVSMASNLGLATVAEGIEEIGELRTLRKLGCHAGQGYLFQRPVPSVEFLKFLRDWPERKRQSQFASIFESPEYDPRSEFDPLYGIA
jgi:EAL domain-containing protein (putative c-di-GMP-specific phosphodiesterase class I)/GGDEF domain-containing protein